MHSSLHLLRYALPVVIAIAAIEAAILIFVRKQPYNWKASLASLTDALARDYVIKPYLNLSIALPAIIWAITHNIGAVPLDPWLAFLVLFFFGQEFAYYWFHRCSHRMRWLWATHAVHPHSPNELNFLGGLSLQHHREPERHRRCSSCRCCGWVSRRRPCSRHARAEPALSILAAHQLDPEARLARICAEHAIASITGSITPPMSIISMPITAAC